MMRKWWLSQRTNPCRVHIPTQSMLIGRDGEVADRQVVGLLGE